MKLATFREQNNERFGIVLRHPVTGEDWVFDPNRVQDRLILYASRGTSPLNANPPIFFEQELPSALASFLATGQLDNLHRMEDFLRRFLEQADQYILKGAGFPLHEVQLLAPIPRPRLFFGLVQNSPTAWRSRPERTHLNLFPQGHQRPQGSVLNPYDPIVLPDTENVVGGWNPELGVIIGKGGRDIPVEKAMSHVAGLTIISDVTFDYFRQDVFAQEPPYDWFEDAMSSWGDKKSDARTPMGPYLVTMDEVGNPYDLLIYTRQSGMLRDRSHTGAMALGIERTIHWLSQFATLHAGDVIHMGTMGYDGSPYLSEFIRTDTDFIESEIEKLGVLRNPMVIASPEYDWRDENDPARTIHPSPVVRDLISKKQEKISLEDWMVEDVRHVWLTFGNYKDAEKQENLKPRPYPRFLGAPNSVLAQGEGSTIEIPASAGEIWLGCELAIVVGQLASQISSDVASEYILAYMPMLSIYDTSFEDSVIEPASMQERYAPQVYGHWRDGFNVLGIPKSTISESANCLLQLETGESAEGDIVEYHHPAPDVLAYISTYITLFPGDVITLGRLSKRLLLDVGTNTSGYIEIDGFPRLNFQIVDKRK